MPKMALTHDCKGRKIGQEIENNSINSLSEAGPLKVRDLTVPANAVDAGGPTPTSEAALLIPALAFGAGAE